MDTNLLNHWLEASNISDVHPTIQTEIMHNVEEKQTLRNLRKLKRQHQHCTFSVDCARACLDPALPSDDSAYVESKDIPNNFVHLRDDGEFKPFIHP